MHTLPWAQQWWSLPLALRVWTKLSVRRNMTWTGVDGPKSSNGWVHSTTLHEARAGSVTKEGRSTRQYLREWWMGESLFILLLTGRYRCLPAVMLLGVSKCGTTDLYHRMIQHPLISPSRHKEPHWFTRGASVASFKVCCVDQWHALVCAN